MTYQSGAAQSDFLEYALLASLVILVVAVFGFSLLNAGGEALRQLGGRFPQ